MSTTAPSISTTTVITATIGTAITGLAAYAVYFDYKRRHDVEFRKQLKRESKRQAKAAKEEAEGAEKKNKAELRAMVDEAVAEGWPTDAEEKEGFFMEEVGMGERLCQMTGMEKEAAICFFKALRVYPQPKELMTIYDKTVPKNVLDTLAEMEAYYRVSTGDSSTSARSASADGRGGRNSSSNSSTAGVE